MLAGYQLISIDNTIGTCDTERTKCSVCYKVLSSVCMHVYADLSLMLEFSDLDSG